LTEKNLLKLMIGADEEAALAPYLVHREIGVDVKIQPCSAFWGMEKFPITKQGFFTTLSLFPIRVTAGAAKSRLSV